MSSGLRDRKKAQTRDRIAIAAVEKFLELGTEGATIAAIADAAEVSPRTFHNYFARREDAFLHFCTQQIGQAAELMTSLDNSLGPVDALEEVISDFYLRPAGEIHSFAAMSKLGEHLRPLYISETLPCQQDNVMEPLVTEIIRRSSGSLSRFQATLLLSFGMAVVDSIQFTHATGAIANTAEDVELLKDGFARLRSGFGH